MEWLLVVVLLVGLVLGFIVGLLVSPASGGGGRRASSYDKDK